MKQFLLILCALLIPAGAFSEASLTVCDFYTKKADELGCDADNYLRKFGYKYCRRFVEIEPRFTPDGQKAFSAIRPCLIETLKSSHAVTCDNVKAKAQDSHVSCYMKHGFCRLGWSDRFTVLNEVWLELFDPEFLATLRRIEQGCQTNR